MQHQQPGRDDRAAYCSIGMSPLELPAARIGRRPIRLQIRTGLTGPSSNTSGSARYTIEPPSSSGS
jgi:hypothetical protein